MAKVLPRGLMTALVTPFLGGRLEEEGIGALLSLQLLQGVEGVVIAGTTGEVSTLAETEFVRLLSIAIERRKDRTVLLAGTGTNSTAATIRRARLAEELGYDGLLVVAPYYNRPSPEGVFAHYAAVAEAVELPIVLYSNKARCGIEIDLETILKLHETYPHICGLKDSGVDCNRVGELHRKLGENFSIYSGDDAMALPAMAVGADGVIGVASNLFPDKMRQLVRAALANDLALARKLHLSLLPLWQGLSCDVNPVPIKFALHEMGLIHSEEVRLPLVQLSPEHREGLRALLGGVAAGNGG
ncbi:MAG: 4-hydroxy-tetrahydrodipicolinate synthase [Puniceicoccales bacterium]|jgi:4-hydroxy-tetrahydrodipicolinate synthase|nr:4-hydroxy-tetrahydrodipicolinate synthase [Puniceicoccales bacterium]